MEYPEIDVNNDNVTLTIVGTEKTPYMVIKEAEIIWKKKGKNSCYDYFEKHLDSKNQEDIPSYLFMLSRICHEYLVKAVLQSCLYLILLLADILFMSYNLICYYDKVVNSYALYIHGGFSLVIVLILIYFIYSSYILNKILDVLLEY